MNHSLSRFSKPKLLIFFIFLLSILFFFTNIRFPKPKRSDDAPSKCAAEQWSIVILTFNRYQNLNNTMQNLASILSAPENSQYLQKIRHIIVNQQKSQDEQESMKISHIIAKDILSHKNMWFLSNKLLHYVFDPLPSASPSSTEEKKYGSASNVANNVLRAANLLFEVHPELEYSIIIEDDVEVSKDVFAYFERAEQVMRNQAPIESTAPDDMASVLKGRIELASAAFFLYETHPRYDWRLDRPMKYKSRHKKEHLKLLDSSQMYALLFDGNVEFKVLCWMASKHALKYLANTIRQHINFLAENDYSREVLPPLLQECKCGWHYDRLIEHIFRGSYFIAPHYPRVTHVSSEGLNYHKGAIEESQYYPLNPADKYVTASSFKFKVFPNTLKMSSRILSVVGRWVPLSSCPDKMQCYAGDKFCGSVDYPTCFSIWNGCTACDGRDLAKISEMHCLPRFSDCCTENGSNTCKAFPKPI